MRALAAARMAHRTERRRRKERGVTHSVFLLFTLLLVGTFGVRTQAFAHQDLSLPGVAAWQQPQPDTAVDGHESTGDFAIPGGEFFTQALPGRVDGAGFAVQDGHGAKLWTAFLDRGGVEALGYPISRRFEWEGHTAQAFERGILRWDAEVGEAELLPRASLPGSLPTYAIEPDSPPIMMAELETKPWSGWWWPAADGIGPTLYSENGPLARYDRYVERATGESPHTRDWELQEVYFPSYSWAGHCNGWAAASLLEPEPTAQRDLLGVHFTIGHQKGLLSAYHFADAAAWSFGEDGGTVNPADFHRALLTWLASRGKGFILTFDLGNDEVWSYPVYAFTTAWGPDPQAADVWRVKTIVWTADTNVPPDFVGLKPYPGPAGQTFEYVLHGDPRDPTGGAWTGKSESGRFAHPGRVWYPEPKVRNLGRQLASPNLDRETIAGIIAPSVESASVE